MEVRKDVSSSLQPVVDEAVKAMTDSERKVVSTSATTGDHDVNGHK